MTDRSPAQPAPTTPGTGGVIILGVFVADTTYRADRAPKLGETIIGNSFALGPGGKGSNQSVAAARAGARVRFIGKLGQDNFAEIALALWQQAGVEPAVTRHADGYTGAAYIFVEEASGANSVIICPGIGATLSAADVQARRDLIASGAVFMTQLEQPLEAAHEGLRIAREAGLRTVLNPAPAADLSDDILALCDFVTPNESEAEALTGLPVTGPHDAERAARALLARGAGAAIVTLGAQGVFYCDGNRALHLPAIKAGPVVETTGAGDAFNGGFAAALSEGLDPVSAVRFGNAVAALSVTRAGTAQSMPARDDIDALLARQG